MFSITDGELKISVRNLVEFIYRTGNIDNRVGGVSETDAMQAGSRIHKKIQKAMGTGYRAEVSMQNSYDTGRYRVVVEGRADGVFSMEDCPAIDEIKGMYADVTSFTESIYVHQAQAMCYGYFYLCEHEDERIAVQLTYVNLDTEEIKRFIQYYTRGELADWYGQTMKEFLVWADFLYDWSQKRDESIRGTEFPFAYREGQRELAVSVYKTIQRKKVLFIQAPTGVGKTISTVFPSVKAVGEGLGDKVFYLTAKTITRTAAESAFDLLRGQGLQFKTIILTAKEKLCAQGMKCNPADCPYAGGHFDRVNDAVLDIIENECRMDRETILKYAEKHTVCPFEFALDISYWCDGIICDYNYVFDPNAYLRRYFGDGNKGKYLFLIDEAHNLVERGREMYSAAVYKEDVMEFKRMIKGHDVKLYKAAERVNKALLEIKRQVEETFLLLDSAGVLTLALSSLYEEILRFNEEHREFEYKEEVLEFFFKVRDFIYISELVDENYVIYAMIFADGDLMVRQYCVNPSKNLNDCLAKGNAAVFFSATLLPMGYYRSLLRGEKDDYAIYAKSPFDEKKRCVLIAKDVTTRYAGRNEKQYRRVYEYIVKMVRARRGNYMVFFPSYAYMRSVLDFYMEEDFDIILQENDMAEAQKEAFLKEFEQIGRRKSFAAFCVMGGIFSEGIDLKEESLIGAVIVGTGLPQVGVERKILMDRFSEEGRGFEYAYIYPGLNKVLQSAGRVIRTENDKGVVLLLDERFLTGDYDGLMPLEWSNMEIVDINSVEKNLFAFWEDL